MTPDNRLHRTRRRLIVTGVLFAALATGAIAWYRYSTTPPATDRFLLATVQRGELEDVVTATGTLQPRDHVDVGAQVSGQLTKIHVTVGEHVEAGTLLAQIDATVYRARVDERRAQLRNLRAQLDERAAQLDLARLQARRQKNLIVAEATTTEAVQAAEATLRSARAQIEALRAQIAQAESSLRADEANLDYARIYAPMAGTVVSITARQGQTLNTNQSAPVILRIADLSTMTVQTQVSEADIARLHIGMAAYFTTLGDARRRWRGTLEKIEPTPTVTNNVVLYNALFDVPNAEHALMTQMTAQVFFVTAQARDALLVPMGALRFAGRRGTAEGEARHATVQVVAADGSVVEREVTLGTSNRIQAQVLSGLEAGEQVIAGLRDGEAGEARRRPLRGL